MKLHHIVKRVKAGERVELKSPGVPAFAFVPLSDLALVKKIEGEKRPGKKHRKRRTVAIALEDFARYLEERAAAGRPRGGQRGSRSRRKERR